MTKYANIIINGVLETKHCKDNDNDASWRTIKKKVVKNKRLFTVHVLFTVHTRSWEKDKLKLKLKLNVQKNGTMAVLQFLSTARVSTQE